MGVVLKKTFVGLPELPDQTLDIAVAAIAASTAFCPTGFIRARFAPRFKRTWTCSIDVVGELQ